MYDFYMALSALSLLVGAYFLLGVLVPKLPLAGTRGRAAAFVGLSLVGLVTFGVIARLTLTPDQRNAMDQQRAVERQVVAAKVPPKAETKTPERLSSESASESANEPCTVEADDEKARAAANNWCQEGVFTHVAVKASGSTFVANLQFSKKAFARWEKNRLAVRNQFRKLTAEISSTVDMNVAISLHDTTGRMVGGCAQRRAESEPTCR